MPIGIRNDLRERLLSAHRKGFCTMPMSASDSHRLREAYRRGDIACPFKGMYALPEVWESYSPYTREWQKLRTLARKHPNWVFCDVSAAVLYGLDVSYSLLDQVHVARDKNSHTRSRADITFDAIHGDTCTQLGITKVTTLERTVFDCARHYAFPHALGIADSALRYSGRDTHHFLSYCDDMHKNHRDIWRAKETIELANGKAENGGESYARAIMIQQGFMMPKLQVEIQDTIDQSLTYRVDFFWDLSNYAVAGELDGREKYVNPQMTRGQDALSVLTDERLRESRITASVRVARFSFADVLNTSKFCRILEGFGIPRGFDIPRVALG